MTKAILVEGLSKRYRLRHLSGMPHGSLREAVPAALKRAVSRLGGSTQHGSEEEFWALRDVNFEIHEGDRLGVIGRNGAGKSTLLKLLSRITDPTAGRITIHGRVASLLEVGTGFNPELSGRENIFLNGAILGMSRRDIARRFDEIVAFAEVERFLDTPVKRYSSGMYMRLAFSVAAHLEPDILIVDEVLAVGDHQFQAKCLGRMQEVGAEGRTVLFVSHNMGAVAQMCNKVMALQAGRVATFSEDVSGALKHFFLENAKDGGVACGWENDGTEFPNAWFTPKYFRVVNRDGVAVRSASRGEELWVEIEGDIATLDRSLQVGYALYDENGVLLYWTGSNDGREEEWPPLTTGRNIFRSPLPLGLLNAGTYRLELLARLVFTQWVCEPAVSSPSISIDIRGALSDSPYWTDRRPGAIAPLIAWTGAQGKWHGSPDNR